MEKDVRAGKIRVRTRGEEEKRNNGWHLLEIAVMGNAPQRKEQNSQYRDDACHPRYVHVQICTELVAQSLTLHTHRSPAGARLPCKSTGQGVEEEGGQPRLVALCLAPQLTEPGTTAGLKLEPKSKSFSERVREGGRLKLENGRGRMAR